MTHINLNGTAAQKAPTQDRSQVAPVMTEISEKSY